MQKDTEAPDSTRGYEVRDVNVRFLYRVVVGLFALTAVGMGASLWFLNTLEDRRQESEARPWPLARTLPQQPPEPRLQVTPPVDLQRVKALERDAIGSYAWMDAKSGIVRIPVERAIELLAERGLPVRPEAAPRVAAAPAKK